MQWEILELWESNDGNWYGFEAVPYTTQYVYGFTKS